MKSIKHNVAVAIIVVVGVSSSISSQADNVQSDLASRQAEAVVAKMTLNEKDSMLHGILAFPGFGEAIPKEAILGAGFVRGVPRVGVPDMRETDASLGVTWVGGLRHDGAVALPSGMALGSTWNPDVLRAGGSMIGAEAAAKGFNVLLAGGANLIRDPRNGRNFEYLSEDPLLTGSLVSASIHGIQSQHVLSTIKHFALNNQETGRKGVDVLISDSAARESDLLAFEIGIEKGNPGAVMCSYNLVNHVHACDSDYLLNTVLKRDWGYRGFVMSDWGAVPRVDTAMHGLDQQSGEQLDHKVYFAGPMLDAAKSDPAVARRMNDMAVRIARSLLSVGVTQRMNKKAIDGQADAEVSQRAAEEGMVLLRNESNMLPLASGVHRILVVGGYADYGVLSGGGSSQVESKDGPALSIPIMSPSPFSLLVGENFQRSVPLDAIKARAHGAEVVFRNGRYISDAVAAAKNADIVVVFANQWTSEGFDVPDLSLPAGQDELISAVSKANPNTIVVLENGGPVLMPWLKDCRAVLEAWYPGARGAQAIAAVLFGDVNPSGRLPVSFPASVAQLPRPKLDGSDSVEPNFLGDIGNGTLPVDYNIEGSDVGYRWFARQHEAPLFPFGFGLSYTQFIEDGLRVAVEGDSLIARLRVRNIGRKPGKDVVEVYMTQRPGGPKLRLAAFEKVMLQPGESREVALPIDKRIVADWSGLGWTVDGGTYEFAVGKDAASLGAAASVQLARASLNP